MANLIEDRCPECGNRSEASGPTHVGDCSRWRPAKPEDSLAETVWEVRVDGLRTGTWSSAYGYDLGYVQRFRDRHFPEGTIWIQRTYRTQWEEVSS